MFVFLSFRSPKILMSREEPPGESGCARFQFFFPAVPLN